MTGKPPAVDDDPRGGAIGHDADSRPSRSPQTTRPATTATSPTFDTIGETEDAARELDDLRRILLDPKALADPVQKSLFVAIHHNRDEVADVIFPVIGPAIRRAISQALSHLVENTNRVLEDSLSLRSLAWRVEAMRTGRPLAEVALVHSLQYEVEQVFLIHRESGLLIRHAAGLRTLTQPPEVVSGMLTGIRDFVQDSFGSSDDDGVRRLEVGDRTVWVEQRGSAILAAVVKGMGPAELAWQLQETLEDIVARHALAIAEYAGEDSGFEDVDPDLRACLRAERKPRVPGRPWAVYSFAGLVVLLAVVLGVWQWSWRTRATQATALLRDEPGYQLRRSDVTWWKLELIGVRDPLSRPVEAVIEPAGLQPDALDAIWIESRDPHPRLALKRVQRILQPPASVDLLLGEDGGLVVTGTATAVWSAGLQRLVRTVDGIRCADVSRLKTRERVDAELAAFAVERVRLEFSSGQVLPDDPGRLDVLRNVVAALDAAAWQAQARAFVHIEGRADSTGSDALNRRLSLQRAQAVAGALDALPLWNVRFTVSGQTDRDPELVSPSASAPAAATDRSVRLRVELRSPVWYEPAKGCR